VIGTTQKKYHLCLYGNRKRCGGNGFRGKLITANFHNLNGADGKPPTAPSSWRANGTPTTTTKPFLGSFYGLMWGYWIIPSIAKTYQYKNHNRALTFNDRLTQNTTYAFTGNRKRCGKQMFRQQGQHCKMSQP